MRRSENTFFCFVNVHITLTFTKIKLFCQGKFFLSNINSTHGGFRAYQYSQYITRDIFFIVHAVFAIISNFDYYLKTAVSEFACICKIILRKYTNTLFMVKYIICTHTYKLQFCRNTTKLCTRVNKRTKYIKKDTKKREF